LERLLTEGKPISARRISRIFSCIIRLWIL
jgi:hypothetical protein